MSRQGCRVVCRGRVAELRVKAGLRVEVGLQGCVSK